MDNEKLHLFYRCDVRTAFVSVAAAGVMLFAAIPNADAIRGGWEEPAQGWEFVEEWQQIPRFTIDEYEPGENVWSHANGSDEFSNNAHTALFEMAGWEHGDVVRTDVVPGLGDTEDGATPAENATVLTLINLGDPRQIGSMFPDLGVSISDPSDRKHFFTAVVGTEEDFGLEFPLVEGGVTLLVRYRMMPLDAEAIFQQPNADAGDPPFNFAQRPWIPRQFDRSQAGIGYVDPVFPEYNIAVGVGFYAENSLFINGNGMDGSILISDQLDTTEFHSVWLTAIADEEDEFLIHVRAWLNGSAEPVAEGTIERGPGAVSTPDPHPVGEFSDIAQSMVEVGMAATNNYGALQCDYICAIFSEAVEPVAIEGVAVHDWQLF